MTKDDELGPYQQAVANLTNKNKFVPLCPMRSGERMVKCKGPDCRWWCADDKECWIVVACRTLASGIWINNQTRGVI